MGSCSGLCYYDKISWTLFGRTGLRDPFSITHTVIVVLYITGASRMLVGNDGYLIHIDGFLFVDLDLTAKFEYRSDASIGFVVQMLEMAQLRQSLFSFYLRWSGLPWDFRHVVF